MSQRTKSFSSTPNWFRIRCRLFLCLMLRSFSQSAHWWDWWARTCECLNCGRRTFIFWLAGSERFAVSRSMKVCCRRFVCFHERIWSRLSSHSFQTPAQCCWLNREIKIIELITNKRAQAQTSDFKDGKRKRKNAIKRRRNFQLFILLLLHLLRFILIGILVDDGHGRSGSQSIELSVVSSSSRKESCRLSSNTLNVFSEFQFPHRESKSHLHIA